MKRQFSIVLAASLLVLLGVAPQGLHAQAPVTIQFAHPGWDSDAQRVSVMEAIGQFERQNPGIRVRVELMPYGSMRDALFVAARGGSAPDVIYMLTRWSTEFAVAGLLLDLTPYLKEVDRSDFIPASWASVAYKGGVYGIPGRREASQQLFYNLDMFEAAGLRHPPKDMDEFLDYARKLTKGNVYGFGFPGAAADEATTSYFLTFVWSFGGDLLDKSGTKVLVNSEAGVRALQLLVDMFRVHKVAPPSTPGNTKPEVRRLFVAGQEAMYLDGVYAHGTLLEMNPTFRWVAAAFPSVPYIGGWDVVIPKGTRYEKEAWAFVKYYTSPEVMAKTVVTLPTRRSSMRDSRFQASTYRPYIEALLNARQETPTPYFAQISVILRSAFQAALLGQKTPKAALDGAAQKITEAVGK